MNPNAREAMNKFKMEAANQVGVNLKNGYNGELTSRQAGSIGGQMVKNIKTVRLKNEFCFERPSRTAENHRATIKYITGIVILEE